MTKAQREEILEQGRKEARDYLPKIANYSGTQGANAI